MSAPRHQRAALWQQAVEIRAEWETIGTAYGPSDEVSAEQAIGHVYTRLGRPRPEFVWVRSPREAQPKVDSWSTLDDLYTWVKAPPPGGKPPLASDLAAYLTGLRSRLDDRITIPWDSKPPKRDKGKNWPDLPVDAALDYGIPFTEIVRRHVRDHLFAVLAHGFYLPAKRMLGSPEPVCWYGQQESHWLAYYDVWRQLGVVAYDPFADAELDVWQTLARSAGWFWPGETQCVVSHKPVAPFTFADGWRIRV